MTRMPTLGPPPRSNPLVKVLITSLVIGGLSGGAWWLWGGGREAPAPAVAPVATAPSSPTGTDPDPGMPSPTDATGPARPAAPSLLAEAPRAASGPRHLRAIIRGRWRRPSSRPRTGTWDRRWRRS